MYKLLIEIKRQINKFSDIFHCSTHFGLEVPKKHHP